MANMLWLQGGACSGNTMSFLNAEEASACDLVAISGRPVEIYALLGEQWPHSSYLVPGGYGLDLSPEADRAATIVADRIAALVEAHVGAAA